MMFSVLIPVYNTSAYLVECIESVIQQTEKDYEIVLINDGSTDKSGEICDEYAQKYPHIRVIHKQNEGLLLTRRRGFQEAKGDYCICVDSDDGLADKDALKKLRILIDKEACDLIVYEYIYGKKQDDSVKRMDLFDLPDKYVFQASGKNLLYNKLLIGRGLNPLCIKCISRDIINVYDSYDEQSKSLFNGQGEDTLQSFPILNKAKKAIYLKEPLYFYRWNENSISRNLNLNFYYAYKTIYKTADEYIKLWNIEDQIVEQHKHHRIFMIMGVLCNGLMQGKKTESKQFIESLSKDDFFKELFNVKQKQKVLLYYRMVAFLINHNCQNGTLWLISIVSQISRWKKGRNK